VGANDLGTNVTHLTEEDLVLIYYREPGIPENADAHLDACARCRAEFDALAETLNACLDWSTPEPPPDFGHSVWAQLAPQMTEKKSAVRQFWQWAPAFAAVLFLVAAAFVAGRWSRHAEPALTAGLSPAARERIFAISMADHLDRAEVLLTGLENVDETDAAAFDSERQQARDLVSEGRLMQQVVASRSDGSGERKLLPLLDEIERLVLEVANAPDHAGPQEIRDLKQWIGADSLLFKVRIIESNLRSGGRKT
jgi:hypothetical protein